MDTTAKAWQSEQDRIDLELLDRSENPPSRAARGAALAELWRRIERGVRRA